ncbi:cysteine desulfurase/selenocysteine lyase [Inquilinus ginsengisoli]|uniref:Cysteine desulfurase n=1 Tax=Inquilinus ginsengisoli TaxID=363840 RepID=A0ABU1JR89_9PROT|nr:cysteine desulfurase [Inquilinus ginsengisoli]MDR6291136.1 cysteine desulfurase/selenocysteine lyase [Inquilinus ginsengisoli]
MDTRMHTSGINTYDVNAIRADFPILSRTVYGKPLVYLDNAASAQKPLSVIEAESRVYKEEYANVHRGLHYLSGAATDAFEASREAVKSFINARSIKEVIYTRGTTEAINLVAQTWGRAFLKQGDEIIVSVLEHHSNIVPWQLLAQEKGLVLKVAPIDDEGNFLLDEFEKLLSPKTKLVALTYMSNALGTIVPIKAVIDRAHAVGAKVLIDAAQAITHMPVDVQALGCDFLAFSGHKLYGPTGIGILYGREELLEAMPPWQGGGEMIRTVSFSGTTYADLPAKFEAGTPAIAQAIALKAAIDYVTTLGLDTIAAHERELLDYGVERLSHVPGLTIVGRARERASIISFAMDCAHPHDIGTVIDQAGVAVRAGHHCAQPLMERLCLPATARASFALYNTKAEIDVMAEALDKVVKMFAR